MKILRLITTMNPESGGPCQGIRNFIPELDKLGVKSEVVCMDNPEEAFLAQDKFTIHALGISKTRWQYNSKLLPWLKNNLSNYNIVICDGLWLFPSFAMYKALKYLKSKKDIKVPTSYIMPHGMLDPYFQKAKERKWKAVRNWLYWKLIERKVVNSCDGVLFTCEPELILARDTFKLYRPKSELNVGYGIQDAPEFTLSMQLAFEKKCPGITMQPYLLYLSRIAKKKGIEILIQAYANLAMEHVDLPKLVIAGPGKESSYGQELVQSVLNNPDLADKIIFPGMLSGDSKWGAFYGCEAFILPSHQENFGIAVVEAMACRKPVLISKQVNIWQKIQEESGGLAEEDTVEGVVKMLESWQLMNEYERKKMGFNARTIFEKQFEIEQAASHMLTTLA